MHASQTLKSNLHNFLSHILLYKRLKQATLIECSLASIIAFTPSLEQDLEETNMKQI